MEENYEINEEVKEEELERVDEADVEVLEPTEISTSSIAGETAMVDIVKRVGKPLAIAAAAAGGIALFLKATPLGKCVTNSVACAKEGWKIQQEKNKAEKEAKKAAKEKASEAKEWKKRQKENKK